jgi:hypothetical protein
MIFDMSVRLRRNIVMLVLTCLPALAAAGPEDGTWSQVSPPPGRFGHASAYDPVRDRMLVFGGTRGFGGGYENAELLSLQLSDGAPLWVPLHALGTPPRARYAHTMVYDPVRDRMLVFGGNTSLYYPETVWALSLSGTPTWTQLITTGTPPPPRHGHVAVYDPVWDRMLVFGGARVDSLTNDVWALYLLDTPTWLRLTPSGDPPLARRGASGVYDSKRQRLVIFGGYQGGYRGTCLSDVWELSLVGPLAWTEIVPSGTGPSPRAFHSATYDADRDEMVVYGGSDSTHPSYGTAGTFKSDVFALSFSGTPTWSSITTSGEIPEARGWSTVVRDPVRRRDIVFAGLSSRLLPDLWALNRDGPLAWTALPPSNPYFLAGRCGASMILDSAHDRLILFGGIDGAGFVLGDLWEWPLAPGRSPRPLAALGTPPSPRQAASAIYDPVRERMILYGGVTAAPQVVGELWELTLSGTPTWTRVTPSGGSPVARQAHSAVYDPVSDAMIVFGGLNGSVWRNDVWRLSLRGPMKWTNITPPASGEQPSPRADHVAVLDPVQHRMYVYGGDALDTQTWRLELSGTPAWSVEPTVGPQNWFDESPAGATAVYDAARNRGILFAGDFRFPNGTWELAFSKSGATWKELSPDGAIPAGRYRSGSAYDPFRDRMLVFGGRYFNSAFSDLVSLQWQGAPAPEPSPLSLAPPWPNPSSGGVAISFTMPVAGHASVRLYDVHGRLVRELLNGTVPAGPHELLWDRRTTAGERTRSGVYFVEFQAGGERGTRKIVATD